MKRKRGEEKRREQKRTEEEEKRTEENRRGREEEENRREGLDCIPESGGTEEKEYGIAFVLVIEDSGCCSDPGGLLALVAVLTFVLFFFVGCIYIYIYIYIEKKSRLDIISFSLFPPLLFTIY